MDTPSTRPYLIRALHEWCSDNGLTPYITVAVDSEVDVPKPYVREGQITLNIGFDATQQLILGNETLSFKARFGGVAHAIEIPVGHVLAIYAQENGVGMGFDLEKTPEKPKAPSNSPPDGSLRRPRLQRIK